MLRWSQGDGRNKRRRRQTGDYASLTLETLIPSGILRPPSACFRLCKDVVARLPTMASLPADEDYARSRAGDLQLEDREAARESGGQ